MLEIAKPSKGGGSSKAMANANAAVNPPKPDKPAIEQLMEDAAKNVNKKNAETRFDGSCLVDRDYKSIATVTCTSKFKDLVTFFEYTPKHPKEKFPVLESI